jgi:hypothetical protein
MRSYFVCVATKHARGNQGQFPFPNILLKPIYWQLLFYERDYRMNKVNDLMLFESVILHCQMTHNISGTREALVAAQKDGLVDFYNQLTSAGRNLGQMMLSNLEDYQTLFDVEFKKPPDFFDQQAVH